MLISEQRRPTLFFMFLLRVYLIFCKYVMSKYYCSSGRLTCSNLNQLNITKRKTGHLFFS